MPIIPGVTHEITKEFDYEQFREITGFKEVSQVCEQYGLSQGNIREILQLCHYFEVNASSEPLTIDSMLDIDTVKQELRVLLPYEQLTEEDKILANQVNVPRVSQRADGSILLKYIQPSIDNPDHPFYGLRELRTPDYVGHLDLASLIYSCWGSAKLIQAATDINLRNLKPSSNMIGFGFTSTALTGTNSKVKTIDGVAKIKLMQDLQKLFIPFINSLANVTPMVNGKESISVTTALTYSQNPAIAGVLSIANMFFPSKIKSATHKADVTSVILSPSRSIDQILKNFKTKYLSYTKGEEA